MFQLTFEDDEILHLQDPQTGEISKDNFVSYSLERKLLDTQDTSARRKKMKKEDELNRKERLLRSCLHRDGCPAQWSHLQRNAKITISQGTQFSGAGAGTVSGVGARSGRILMAPVPVRIGGFL